jgi:hypothetical protein
MWVLVPQASAWTCTFIKPYTHQIHKQQTHLLRVVIAFSLETSDISV